MTEDPMYNTYTHSHCCCGHAEPWWWPPYHPWMHHTHPHVHAPATPVEHPKFKMPFIEYVEAASSPKEFIVGGLDPAQLTLEYMKAEGVPAPYTVKVVVLGPGGTTVTWDDPAVADGYHVKTDFAPILPGSKIVVTVVGVIARLRWCETFHCS